MRARVIVSIVVLAEERVTPGLLLQRASELKGVTIHEFEALDLHEPIDSIAAIDPQVKLVRFHVDCEGPEEVIQRLLDDSDDFAGDESDGNSSG